jgi:hypothetical protein
MAVCTSTVKLDLEIGVNWPICMRMFIHQNLIEPMCKTIGFKNIKVDTSNDLMQYELPEDAQEEAKSNP